MYVYNKTRYIIKMTSTEVYNGQLGGERVVHVVHQATQPQSIFTPWNLFAVVSIALFLAYLYYSYTSSMTLKSEEKDSPFVTEVTSPEVSSSVLNGDGSVKVVLMHATWCEHCRIMMPAYNSAAESTRQIRWLKIEQANAAPILKTRTDIRGFPTIFGVKSNGEIVQYGERESRTEDALRKWALQLISPSPAPPPNPEPTPNPAPPPNPAPTHNPASTESSVSVKMDAVSQTRTNENSMLNNEVPVST
jgi:thiol-disulfide isomerase/thioredoxin